MTGVFPRLFYKAIQAQYSATFPVDNTVLATEMCRTARTQHLIQCHRWSAMVSDADGVNALPDTGAAVPRLQRAFQQWYT